ncbi:MAG: M23 family metallopeptidase [bacterium]|nr:M23 family metallopeptidase [bacterium]
MRKWTIIIDNEFKASNKPLTLEVTGKQVSFALTAFIIFVVFSLSLIFFAQANNLNPDSLIKIYAKRDYLLNSIDNTNKQLNTYLDQINKITEFEKRIRTLSNLNQLSEDLRQLGLGGYDFHDERLSNLDMPTKRLIENVDKRFFQVKNLVEFEMKNVASVGSNLLNAYDLITHTPSVIPTSGSITSDYGYRRDPFNGRSELHTGIDIANQSAPPVYAPADGKVIYADYLAGYGKTLKIDHGYGYITVYAHLNKFSVKVGDIVKRHQMIGHMGSTGRSTGTHLHYEVRVFEDRTDPCGYFDSDTTVE